MTTLATDDFNRADSGTLGANWTTPSLMHDLTIVSNKCRPQNDGAQGAGVYTGVGAFPLDQWCQVVSDGANYVGLVLRGDTTGTFYVMFTGAGNWIVNKVIAGVYTQLDSVSQATTNGDVLYFEVQGTALVSKINGVTVNSMTDSAIDGSIVGGPYPGLNLYPAGPPNVDDFAAGDFAGGTSLPVMLHHYQLLRAS